MFELYGTGEQTRDFTFVDDVVHAMRSAANSEFTGVANIGGGSRISMNQILNLVTELAGPPVLLRRPAQRGDVRDTAADTQTASRGFGYQPDGEGSRGAGQHDRRPAGHHRSRSAGGAVAGRGQGMSGRATGPAACGDLR